MGPSAEVSPGARSHEHGFGNSDNRHVVIEFLGYLAHKNKEKKISREVYEKAVDEVRTNYLKTFGKAAFKKATGCEKVEGCAYDYSVLLPEYWED